MVDKISLYKPQNTLGNEEIDAINEVFKSGWLTLGPKTIEFERVFADFIGDKYGVATSSCTSALYLALDGLGVKKGDLVVVPINTFVATANAIRWIGAEPIFCEKLKHIKKIRFVQVNTPIYHFQSLSQRKLTLLKKLYYYYLARFSHARALPFFHKR